MFQNGYPSGSGCRTPSNYDEPLDRSRLHRVSQARHPRMSALKPNKQNQMSIVWCKWLIHHPKAVSGVGWVGYIGINLSAHKPSFPLCSADSSGWILSIFGTNDHKHESACHAQWPLTSTYIFKGNREFVANLKIWYILSCPLYSTYSSRWILSEFGTNDQ